MALPVNERPYGAVKQTEDQLRDVPLPRRQPTTAPSVPPPDGQPQTPRSGAGAPYELDLRATNPLASVPIDVQEKMIKAKMWYEIAAHPGATEFEIALAHAHFDELAPPEQSTERGENDAVGRKDHARRSTDAARR